MNWKVLIAIAQIAMKARTRIPLILFIFELLRQFDRSLASAGPKKGARRTGKAGYVYVIRDQTGDRWFKTGYRAKPPWLDSHLRASGEFVLIIPAKDAKGLEKRLRRAYAKGRKKREGFDLNERELRELLITAALVQVVAGDDLGMPEVDQEIVQVATDLLRQFQGRADKILKARKRSRPQPDHVDQASKSEPILNDFSAIPGMDWNWESVLTKDYRALPKLKGKEAYLTVIRDNNARQGRIFIDTHVVDSIDSAFVDRSLRFDLEIVLILKVDNKRKAKRDLRLASSDIGENDWVDVSDETFAEIKEFATVEWNRDSIYIGPKTHYGLETLSTDNFRENPNLDEGDSGYVVVVQGAKCGKSMKIWSSRRPRRWTRYSWRARKLNSPKDLASSKNPYRFSCVIKSEHAVSFRRFLCARYRQLQRKRGWYKLDDGHLQEIRNLGR